MSNGIVSLDDISSNDGSTESETSGADDSGADDFAELREACEAIGADAENAIERVKSDDGTDEDSLVEMARELADDGALWSALEEYRAFNDQHRIKQNHLLDSDKEFTDWSGAFYGDSDDPEEGTYNAVQQQARDLGGNLYYYKALFPEPDAEHFPSDTAVVWQERPDEDSHIYVTEEFIDAYGDFTLEIEGKERPVPPWNGASGSGGNASGSSGDWPDAIQQAADAVGVNPSVIDADLEGYPAPNGLTVDSLKDLYDATDDYTVLSRALEIEKATKDRKTAKEYLEQRVERAEPSDDTPDGDSEGKSNEAIAGEIAANTSVDLHPDTITEMLDNDMTRDEIVDRFA